MYVLPIRPYLGFRDMSSNLCRCIVDACCIFYIYFSRVQFALDRGESMSAAIWSDFESIVLAEIVSSFSEPQHDATILRLYNDIVYYSTAPFCIFLLPDNVTFREKNYTQLHAKLQHVGSRQLQ